MKVHTIICAVDSCFASEPLISYLLLTNVTFWPYEGRKRDWHEISSTQNTKRVSFFVSLVLFVPKKHVFITITKNI